jgi:HPt (histidine-containing phosphotransfer) domain-containing protein
VTEEFKRHLEALRADYRKSLPGKLAELSQLWQALLSGALPGTGLHDLRRELHTLAGSATTFGVANVSALAGSAESLLDPFCERGTLPEGATAAEVGRLLDALQQTTNAG